jgi:hypothetical protein
VTDSQTIENINVFKNNPGLVTVVTDEFGTPVGGVK